jgi:polyferredoxin
MGWGCPWGRMRWFLLFGILILNLRRRCYCSILCPCGGVQDLISKLKTPRFTPPEWTHNIRFFMLGLFLSVVIMTKRSYLPLILQTEIILLLLLVLGVCSLFVPRVWCRILCPVGGASEIVLRVKKFIQIWRR